MCSSSYKVISQNSGKLVPVRKLYHTLLNREHYPDSFLKARCYAQRILTYTTMLAPLQTGLRRGFEYDKRAFIDRVDAIYNREIKRYLPLKSHPTVSRAFCLWGIRQMAPAILVDGCWLENIAGAEPTQDAAQYRLVRTFADEVGAGCFEHNHPYIYRCLLENVGVWLPPTSSLAFSEDTSLCNAAFFLPTYLLSIGIHPQSYFPEILGLNLGIELSGLGAGYLHLVEVLSYYGIDPTIIRLHLSIDNLASGHAALARDSIIAHLGKVSNDSGRYALTTEWKRIWCGYLSLYTAIFPFILASLREWCRERYI